MHKVALVTDSSVSLPVKYVDQYEIHVVPSWVHWDGEQYTDGLEITTEQLFQRMQTARTFPTTAAPSPEAFARLFEHLLQRGQDVLGVFASAKLSRIFASACEARDQLNQGMKGRSRIHLIDSGTNAMAVGWPLILAARAMNKGAGLKECEALIRRGLANVGYFGMLETLEYLHRSGRIGPAARYLGSLFDIKVILELLNSQATPVERIRSRKRALARLVELLVERLHGRRPVYLAVLHTNCPEEAQSLHDLACAKVPPVESMVGTLSPTVSTFFGPGTIGFNFLAGVEEYCP